jgi:curli biogenesis system outer membrane secretion channel CsgG
MRRFQVLLMLLPLLALSPTGSRAAKDQPTPTPAPVVVNVPMAERPTLAIVAFDDGSIKRESWWGTSWDIGGGLSDMLTTILLDKNRFRLLERSLLDKAMAEQDLSATARVDPKTAVKIGKVIGADYLIMGKVTQFSWETKSGGGLFNAGGLLGLGMSKTKAQVAVDVRIVDAETAEILGSYSGKGDESRSSISIGKSGFGAIAIGSSDFLGTALGRATRQAISQWADNFCRAVDDKKLTLTPKHRAPVRPDGIVLSVDGSLVVANIGVAKGYAVGDLVEIRRKTKELKDPDTGEILRVLSDLIASGTIVKIDQKTADISVTSTEKGKTPTEGDIVLFTSAASSSSPASSSSAPSDK